jgi:hypothetical protein
VLSRPLVSFFDATFKRKIVSEFVYIAGVSGGIDSQATARFMLSFYGSACVVPVNWDVRADAPLFRQEVRS